MAVESVRHDFHLLQQMYFAFREAILEGRPREQALAAFLLRGMKHQIWTPENIRQATEIILPSSPIPPPLEYIYYDLSYNTQTRELSIAGGEPFHLSRLQTRFLARLISQPEVPHSKIGLYVAIWEREDSSNDDTLRTLVKEVRARTLDTIIPPAKLPETESFSKRTFHRIQSVYDEGFMLKRVWDLDEITQGKDRLWAPSGFRHI